MNDREIDMFTGATDCSRADGPPDGEPKRSRDGKTLVAELRARANQLIEEANAQYHEAIKRKRRPPSSVFADSRFAYRLLDWLDELTDAT